MIVLALEFVRRDWKVWSSYRFAAATQSLGLVVTLFALFLVGKTFASSSATFLTRYGTDYAGYLMASYTFMEVWSVGFLLSRGLRESQAMGTLEAMILSRFNIFQIMLASAAFPTLRALVRLLLFLFVAVVIFGLWHQANILSAGIIFLAGLLAMGCLGILSVSFVLVLKQGDPIWGAYVVLNTLFSGAVFPRHVLPSWLQAFSLCLPLTYALDGMRRALKGDDALRILPQIGILLGFFVLLLPVTIWMLNWAINRARKDGSLVQY